MGAEIRRWVGLVCLLAAVIAGAIAGFEWFRERSTPYHQSGLAGISDTESIAHCGSIAEPEWPFDSYMIDDNTDDVCHALVASAARRRDVAAGAFIALVVTGFFLLRSPVELMAASDRVEVPPEPDQRSGGTTLGDPLA